MDIKPNYSKYVYLWDVRKGVENRLSTALFY